MTIAAVFGPSEEHVRGSDVAPANPGISAVSCYTHPLLQGSRWTANFFFIYTFHRRSSGLSGSIPMVDTLPHGKWLPFDTRIVMGLEYTRLPPAQDRPASAIASEINEVSVLGQPGSVTCEEVPGLRTWGIRFRRT